MKKLLFSYDQRQRQVEEKMMEMIVTLAGIALEVDHQSIVKKVQANQRKSEGQDINRLQYDTRI